MIQNTCLFTAIVVGLLGIGPALCALTNPNPIGDYDGKFEHTSDKWVALNKNMTFSNLSWGPSSYKFDDDRYGHRVVFIDPYNEYEKDNYKRFKEMAKDKHILMCYFSAGTFENYREVTKSWFAQDESRKSLFLDTMGDWPDETWLDISKYDLMKQYIKYQIDLLADFGCHGVEPDNIDCWANEDCVGDDSGSDSYYKKQLKLVKYMANYAHSKGMAIAHKNNGEMIKDIVDLYDCAIAESPHRWGDTEYYSPFVEAGKPVFLTEYTNSGSGALDKFCEASETLGMFLKYQKGSKWENCFSDGEFSSSYAYNDGSSGSGGGSGNEDPCKNCTCSYKVEPVGWKSSKNNDALIGAAAGATGAALCSGFGIFLYSAYVRKSAASKSATGGNEFASSYEFS